VALDFETTGLDLDRDEVVSWGLVPIRLGRVVLSEARYQEVSPAVVPSHSSVRIHGLRPSALREAPPLAEVVKDLRAALVDRWPVVWMAEVETAFLSRVLGGSVRAWRRRTVDALRLSLLLDHLEGVRENKRTRGLAATAGRRRVPIEEAHHALGDAVMTAELFLVLASKLERHGVGDLRRLLRRSRDRLP
jgi:DNA polymerase-3 subunit epsilon